MSIFGEYKYFFPLSLDWGGGGWCKISKLICIRNAALLQVSYSSTYLMGAGYVMSTFNAELVYGIRIHDLWQMEGNCFT